MEYPFSHSRTLQTSTFNRQDHRTMGELLADALKERNDLLEKYPYLKEFQTEINRRLQLAGSFEIRMSVLEIMIESNLVELHENLTQLLTLIDPIPNTYGLSP